MRKIGLARAPIGYGIVQLFFDHDGGPSTSKAGMSKKDSKLLIVRFEKDIRTGSLATHSSQRRLASSAGSRRRRDPLHL